MVIKSIDIENFGNFSNKHFDFTEGINNFIQENGWGKSTLSAFIKAMFYGLDERGNRRKSDIFVERERYLPWNGGKFGGSLTFSVDGKDYKIRRFFDAKKIAEDTFNVTDMQTNRETKKYSKNIGEELFGINKESFERSCFVTLDISKTPELNDDISGKLNNILQAGDDIGNCQNALDTIDSTITDYAGRGKNAKSSRIKSEIEELKNDLLKIDSLEKTIPTLEGLIESAKDDKKEAEDIIKNLEEEKENILLYEQKKHLISIEEELKNENKKKKDIETFFNNNIPNEDVIENLKNEEAKYVQALNDSEHNKVSDSERQIFSDLLVFFGSSIPTNEEIENCQNLLNKEKTLKADLSRKELTSSEKSSLEVYKKQFGVENITDQTIKEQFDYVSKVSSLENELTTKENNKKTLEQAIDNENKETENKGKKIKIKGIIGTVIFAIASIILFITHIPIAGIISSVVALSCLVLGLIIKPKQSVSSSSASLSTLNDEINKINNDISNYKNAYETFIKKINNVPVVSNPTYELSNIRSQYDAYKNLLAKEDEYKLSCSNNKELESIQNEIKDFTAIYASKCQTSDTDNIIRILRNKKADYDKLVDKIPRFDSAIKNAKTAETNLNAWLEDYRVNKTVPYGKQIDELKTNLLEYKQIEGTIIRLSDQIKEFKETNNIDNIMNAKESSKTSDEITQEIEASKLDEHSAISNINSYKEKLDDAYAEIDKKDTLENKKKVKEEELKSIQARVDILNKTSRFLAEAKENLSTKYMGKMEGAFSKYLNSIDDIKDISIDNELNVKVEGEGEVYDKKYLSEGYKDIVNFCTRLALVDAMFENEKPLLVLDDPFVNLDKDKIDNALEIVKTLAKDKQVIYFTCHNSRNID